MKLNPTNDRVIVRRLKRADEEKTSAAGIVLPNVVTESDIGEVIAVGPGRFDTELYLARGEAQSTIPPRFKIGDKVILGAARGQVIWVDGEELLVLREDDIPAVITQEETK